MFDEENQQSSAEAVEPAPEVGVEGSDWGGDPTGQPELSAEAADGEAGEARQQLFAGQYDGEKVPWSDPERLVQEKLDKEALGVPADSEEREAAERRIADRDKPIESDPVGNGLISGLFGIAQGGIFGATSLLRGLTNGFARPGAGFAPPGFSGAFSGGITGSGVIGKTLGAALPQSDVAREAVQRNIGE